MNTGKSPARIIFSLFHLCYLAPQSDRRNTGDEASRAITARGPSSPRPVRRSARNQSGGHHHPYTPPLAHDAPKTHPAAAGARNVLRANVANQSGLRCTHRAGLGKRELSELHVRVAARSEAAVVARSWPGYRDSAKRTGNGRGVRAWPHKFSIRRAKSR